MSNTIRYQNEDGSNELSVEELEDVAGGGLNVSCGTTTNSSQCQCTTTSTTTKTAATIAPE